MNKCLLNVMLFICCLNSFGQQETQYTQYIYNVSSVNPGALGRDNEFKLFLSNRFQWTGVDGAPTTHFLSVESPVDYTNLSIGGNIINDVIGPLSETEIVGNLAYQVPLLHKHKKLSMGVRIGGRFFNVDWSKGKHEFEDPLFLENVNTFVMTFGFGFYFTGNKLFAGFSVNNILPNKIASNHISSEVPHYNLMAGYPLLLKKGVWLKPVVFTRIVDGGSVSIETSMTVEVDDSNFYGGISYRYQNAVGLLVGMKVLKNLKIGYSYDVSTNELSSLGASSHELLAIYTFKKLKYKRENRY